MAKGGGGVSVYILYIYPPQGGCAGEDLEAAGNKPVAKTLCWSLTLVKESQVSQISLKVMWR